MLLQPTEYESIQFVPDANANGYDIGAYWREGATDLLTDLRSRYIGYVLQTGGLLPYLTVRENINLSRRLLHLPLDGKADSLAEKLGIADQLDKLPAMLSVGQRQRAAVARALAHQPVILIADEPTAAVDPINAERIVALLAGLADELGVTLLIATHAHALVQRLGLTLVEHGIQADQDTRMIVTVPPV
jgi:putative ABC transport system ATP-binding protein